MSDSELSDAPSASPLPPDSELDSALRKHVLDALKADDHAEITVALMRRRAEETLGLEPGFYKMNEKWKEVSKRIVHEAFDEHEAKPSLPSKPEASPKPRDMESASSKPANSKKRKSLSHDEGVTKKRRKADTVAHSREEASPSSGELSGAMERESPEVTKPQKQKQHSRKGAKSAHSKAQAESDTQAPVEDLREADEKLMTANNVETSDSELSVLVDEEPRPRKQKKSSAPPKKRGRKSGASNTKIDAEVDPDQVEIKRLQSWLVKCGIRKLWGKELKPYESAKAKIRHLKEMLAEAGMTGRCSLEKANQIKEERELKADIEAVQKGAERWGKNPRAEVEAGDGHTESKRKPVRGPPVLDFLSSDGEETD